MYRPETSHQPVESATRTLSSLPALNSLSNNLPSWTRRSKSSNQSDESFSAYLQHPSSSSPAIDRVLDGRYTNSSGMVNVTPSPLTRRMPSLDTIGYAQERSTPFRHQRTPSLREVAAMLEFERGSANRQAFQRVPSWHDSNSHRDYSPLQRLDFVPPYASETRFRIGESLRSSSASDELVIDQEVDESQLNDDDEEEEEEEDIQDLETSGEADISQESANSKKKRRRTDKNEAKILASVFNETAFPDLKTREALASRLGMSLRAVSIWFQNRRQAMKKRATRFGGVDGIRGATVTAFADLKDEEDFEDVISKPLIHHRLRRWISLDEIALGYGAEEKEDDDDDVENVPIETSLAEPQMFDRLTNSATDNKSCTPILDLIRQRSGKSLTRIASLPSLVAVLKDSSSNKEQSIDNPKKDLRNVLKDLAASRMRCATELKRSISMTETRKVDDLANDLPQPLDMLSCAPMGQLSIQEKIVKVQGIINENQDGIWKRMQSSSSGLSSESTPESDKENRDVSRKGLDEEGDEDEEKTLRRIAQKRAIKQQNKREQSLSKAGLRYMQEADARLALQQKRESASNNIVRQPLANLPSELFSIRTNKKGGHFIRSKLSRVTSLDFEAGRDRSKVIERPILLPLRQLSRVKSSIQLSSGKGTGKPFSRSQSSLPHHHQPGGNRERSSAFVRSLSEKMKSVNKQQVTVNQSSHDSNVSEGGSSEEWTENWANEQNKSNPIKDKSLSEPNSEWWRQTQKRKASNNEEEGEKENDQSGILGHDDSGFFGSDEDNGNSSVVVKKRKVFEVLKDHRQPLKQIQSSKNQTSFTSPTKRGDERDRLAAEALLAFGSM